MGGGGAVRGVDARRSVDGERCEEKKQKKKQCLLARDRSGKTSWRTFQAQQEVNSILSRGTQEINRHHQHIPTLAQAFQHTGRNSGIMLQRGIDSPFGLMLAGEVSITVPFWTVFKCANVCGGLFVRAAQYLHETAAFSFSADEEACGDTGDLKREERHQRDKQRGGEGGGRKRRTGHLSTGGALRAAVPPLGGFPGYKPA